MIKAWVKLKRCQKYLFKVTSLFKGVLNRLIGSKVMAMSSGGLLMGGFCVIVQLPRARSVIKGATQFNVVLMKEDFTTLG